MRYITFQIDPTPTPPPEITSLFVALPSGGVARVDYSVTAGDVFISLLLMLLLALILFVVLRQIAHATAWGE